MRRALTARRRIPELPTAREAAPRAVLFFCLALLSAPGYSGTIPLPGEGAEDRVHPGDGYELVGIPAGEFLMGSPEGEGEGGEHPRHAVRLDAFRIGRYEVTVGQFRRYCRETGLRMPDQMGHGDADPVVNVTWEDAAAFCRWAGLRLPTEAEWEKAARGGTVTAYWWGDVPSHNRANYTGRSGKDAWDDVSPVGSFPPNPYGLYDTAGNVWEWCEDRYAADYYRNSPRENPRGPASGDERVLRGGSWDSPADFLRSARRGWDAPEYSSTLLGFRCAGGGDGPP